MTLEAVTPDRADLIGHVDGDQDVRGQRRRQRGENPDDRVRLVVEGDALSNDAVVVGRKAAAPELIAQDGDPVAAVSIFPLDERAPERRPQPDQRQVARGDTQHLDRLGLARAGQVQALATGKRDLVENLVRVLPCGVFVTRDRDVGVPAAAPPFGQRHQTIGVGKGQRVREHRACHGEHGGIGADPEGQGQDGHRRETWRSKQPT